jgi:TetR/AcrR family transcriptional regulator, transcriptional repressor for nem operon
LSPKGRGQRESTRQVVLDAALRKFSEKSFLGATTIEIAEEAGVSEKTLFDLFGDKKTLYLDVREYIRRSAIRDMLPCLPIGGGAPAILRALGVEFLHEVQRNSDRARVSLQAITAIDDVDIKKSTQEYFLQTQALVTNILAEGQKAGLVKGDVDIDQFAWTYAIALHSVGHVILMDYSMGLDEEAALLFLNRLVDTIEAPR